MSSTRRERMPIVQQGVMTLPYFDDEVPIVYLADGAGYIPVVALCRMLGLSLRTHIPRWRRLFLWVHARKLPLRTETRGTRLVWCLHLGALLFWCSSFNWSLVAIKMECTMTKFALGDSFAHFTPTRGLRHYP